MEQISPREVVLRLRPDELVPDDAQVELWRGHLTEQHSGQVHYCLGVLKAAIEGAAQAIDRGDERLLMQYVSLGLAVTAAYEQVTADQRAAMRE
jgi:hypothetical protein